MTAKPHSYTVTVRLYDAESNKLAETTVSCTGLTPGEVCPPAYIVAREDAKRSPELMRKIAGVAFLVYPSKVQPSTQESTACPQM